MKLDFYVKMDDYCFSCDWLVDKKIGCSLVLPPPTDTFSILDTFLSSCLLGNL